MAVTIKDIALKAGVSRPTVSHALRGDPLIAPDTAARIKRIAADLGYVLSATARRLKRSCSHVIGVIVNRTSDPFHGEVPDGIQEILPAVDYSLFLSSTNHNLDRQKAILQAITERRINGLIMGSMFVTLQCRAERSMFVGPSLTIFDQPKCALGKEAARMMLRC